MPNFQNFSKEARYIVFEILSNIPKINIQKVDVHQVTHFMYKSCKHTVSPNDRGLREDPIAPIIGYYFEYCTEKEIYRTIKRSELDKNCYFSRIKACYWQSDSIKLVSHMTKHLAEIQGCLNQYLVSDLSCLITKYLDQQELTEAEKLNHKNPKMLKLYNGTEINVYHEFEFREIMIQEIMKYINTVGFSKLPSLETINPACQTRIEDKQSWINNLGQPYLIRDYEYVGSRITGIKDWKVSISF